MPLKGSIAIDPRRQRAAKNTPQEPAKFSCPKCGPVRFFFSQVKGGGKDNRHLVSRRPRSLYYTRQLAFRKKTARLNTMLNES